MNSTLKCVCRSDFPSQSTRPLLSPIPCVCCCRCEWGRCIQSDRWNAFRFGHFDTFHVELEQHARSYNWLSFLLFILHSNDCVRNAHQFFCCHYAENERRFLMPLLESPHLSFSRSLFFHSLIIIIHCRSFRNGFGIFLCTRNKYTYLIRIW